MNQSTDNFRPSLSTSGAQQYADANIRSAPPARLRLMLIERAIDVSERLAWQWRASEKLGENETSLTLLELLAELLSGISGGNNEDENQLCLKVADLYVFLIQHLVTATDSSDFEKIDEIRDVLKAEAETWRAVCARDSFVPPPASASVLARGGVNFSV